MSIASDERLRNFAEFVKENDRLTVSQIASEQNLTPNSVKRYARACKEKGYLDEIPGEGVVSDTPDLNQMIEKTRVEAEKGHSRPEREVSQIKVALGDLHLSDEDVMFRSLESATDRLVNYLSGKDYEELIVLNLGDTVSGTGVFYGQEYRNVINTSHWQTLVGAMYQKKIRDKIIDESPIQHVHFDLVKGNHDIAQRGTNLGYYLARDMQALGLSANYHGNFYISDELYCVHGYGMSDYRPQSPKFLRAMSKRASNLNQQGENIERIVSGHCHWLDTDFKYTINLAFDMVGGFQRNKRAELGRVQRPAGFIVYEPDKRPHEIRPDADIFYEEANQEDLEFQNIERIGKLLKQAYELDNTRN